ncbi:hypothetical protein BBBOND_0302880 [Babesia bigemina]|uniref:Uncharacterized protein n=1 Tax=Babesia bigemina TaxID=5866 RepID=A0A061DBW9_BABBI|nr:hypothetical protein BBBOND_0302880 [Babesia bigemina]CDR96384.1 hypothetical protein BBBOND_0302880 [Babesia bigemina]|eukprot:XP_012768570.1 hypothetical protein BBBOND_0302880 [Babesia bigemina]
MANTSKLTTDVTLVPEKSGLDETMRDSLIRHKILKSHEIDSIFRTCKNHLSREMEKRISPAI